MHNPLLILIFQQQEFMLLGDFWGCLLSLLWQPFCSPGGQELKPLICFCACAADAWRRLAHLINITNVLLYLSSRTICLEERIMSVISYRCKRDIEQFCEWQQTFKRSPTKNKILNLIKWETVEVTKYRRMERKDWRVMNRGVNHQICIWDGVLWQLCGDSEGGWKQREKWS